MNTKVLLSLLPAVRDANGRLLRSFTTASQVSDYTGAGGPAGRHAKGAVIAWGRSYDAHGFRDALEASGSSLAC